jgi:hypothetical protein
MSYQRSQQTRQAILDELHVNPRQSARGLSTKLGVTRNSVQSCVVFMTERGEIEKIGEGHGTCYVAKVKTTISAQEVIEEIHRKRQASGKKSNPIVLEDEEVGVVNRPGYYRQKGGGWKSKGGGGQGAVRGKVYVSVGGII